MMRLLTNRSNWPLLWTIRSASRVQFEKISGKTDTAATLHWFCVAADHKSGFIKELNQSWRRLRYWSREIKAKSQKLSWHPLPIRFQLKLALKFHVKLFYFTMPSSAFRPLMEPRRCLLTPCCYPGENWHFYSSHFSSPAVPSACFVRLI